MFIFEEIDSLPRKVTPQLNELMQERRIVLQDGKVINFHNNFHIMATANTDGENLGIYEGRNSIDKAFLSRFFRYEVKQDNTLELKLVNQNKKLVLLMSALRNQKEIATNILSMRQTININKLEKHFTKDEISKLFFENLNE
jgi:MoxR-like ATPase